MDFDMCVSFTVSTDDALSERGWDTTLLPMVLLDPESTNSIPRAAKPGNFPYHKRKHSAPPSFGKGVASWMSPNIPVDLSQRIRCTDKAFAKDWRVDQTIVEGVKARQGSRTPSQLARSESFETDEGSQSAPTSPLLTLRRRHEHTSLSSEKEASHDWRADLQTAAKVHARRMQRDSLYRAMHS
ncbi:hypothetical protein AB1Y20_021438 [Prymnesium parvum]|uniref:Uncharacterized protein n=1 Tax=Prymnesium parvum TaxID=97485 RepID=A0AB34JLI6_PRYPA